MFLIKLILGVFCIYTCVKISTIKCDKIKEEYLFWSSVCISCDSLVSNLSFKKSMVYDALNVDYPSFEYAKLISQYLKGDKLNFPKFLSAEDVLKLNTFLLEVGKSDSKTQKNAILSYKSDFSKNLEISRCNYKKNYGVTRKVGFSIGVMLMILVI